MKQIITSTLTISKPLRLALFLITLFLLPSTASGQDNVTGTSIFTDVSDNSGKFTFTYGDGSTPGLEWEAIRGTADSYIEKNNDGSGIILKKPENQAGAIGFTSKFVVSGNISAGQKLFVLTLGGITGATLTITTTKGDGTLVRTLVNQRSLNSTTIEITADQSIQFDNECLNFAFNLNTTDVQLNQIQFHNMSFAYGITVAGISTATTGSISGDGITGSVLFDNSTKTLTLNGATINDDITWYDSGNLTIEVKGNNTINSGSKYPLHIMKSGTKVSFTTNQDAPGILTLKSTASDFSASKFYDGEGQVDFTNSVMYAEANNNDVVIQKITPYGLTVAGISVTGANAMDISGSGIDGGTGSVKFNVATSTLTLNNAQITGQIESSLSGLNIELIGDNKINASSYSSAIVSTDSSSPLTIKTAESDPLGALNISQNSDPNNTAQIISGFSSVQLSDGLIATCGTSGLYNDLENKYSYAYIAKLLVNQLPVTATNCGNILSDGTVSFVSSNNILTLDNAQALTSISTGFGALTIHLKGNNSIDASGDDTNPPAIMGPGSLTFTKEGDDVKLSMKASGVSVIMNFTSVNYEDAGLYLNTSTPNTGYDTEKKKFYFARNEGNPMNDATLTTKVCYPLWIEENSQATADNINTINNGWGMNDKGELVLSNYSKTNYGSNAIMSNMDNLTINLIGKNTIGCKNDYAPIYSLKSTAQLTFNTDDSDPGSLTLTSSKNDQDKDGKVIKGFSNDDNPTFNNGLGWTSSTENGVTTAAITRVTSYLKIGSVIVTDDNAGNIQGDGITGTVTYNATNTTLTLNTATINGSIKSNIDNLVVHLIGNNTMSGVSASNKPFQYIGNGSGSLSFTQEEVENDNSSEFGRLEASYENTSSFSWTDGYNISTTFETSDKTGWVQETGTTSATIRYVEYYDLWISSMHFNSENLSGVSGGTRFYPKTNTLHLEGFGYSDIIKSQLANLIIEVSGSGNTPTAILYEGSSDGTLLIKNAPSSSSTVNKLTLQNSTGAVISGFSTVTLDGLYFLTPNYPSETTSSDWTPTVKEAIITNEYGITVAGVAVTTTNSSNVLGTPDGTEPTVSYDPTGNVLTLNGYNGTYTAGDFIVSNLSDGLTVNLKGSNSVKVGDGTTNHFAIKNVSASTPYLTFITDIVETPGTFKIDSYASGGPFSGFNSDVNWPKDSNNQLISEGTAMNNNIFVISPDLMVGGKRIVTGNSYTFGEGTVSYTYQDSKNILTLDGAVISGEIECRYDNLTVYLKGENEINPSNSQNSPFSYIGDMVSGTLTFESSEADDGELTLSGAFSETGSSPNKKITSGGYTTTTEFDTGLSYTFGDWIIETSKIYYNPHYGITINSYETTKCNKDNITKTNSGGVFTYSPQAKTLSIPLDYDGSSTDIKSQRDDLIVSISGNTAIRSIIHEPSQSGTLLIKNAPSSSSTVNKLTLQNSTGAVISGFSTVTLDGLYFLTPNYPSVTTSTDWTSSINEAIITNETLSAPTMSSETVDGVSTLTLTSTAGNVPIKYSIDYVDASQTDITDAIYDSSHKPTISKPATVTAKVTLNEVESATTTGKYFGTDPSPFRLISGADPIVLDLTPAIEESDGISITSITGTESNVTYDAGTGKISSSSVGSFNGQVSMSSTEGKTVILNNNFTATFNVQIDISQAVITLDNTELIYNGQEQTVSVQKVMVGDDVVPQDYYEVSGNTGTEIGNYSLTVTAKTRDSQGNLIYNNYTGTATKEWKITNHPTASASELGFNTETQTFSTYYNPNEDFNLPDGYVGYIIKGIEGSKVLTVRISYIPKGVAVLVEKGSSNENPVEEIPSEQPLKGTFEPLDVTSITGGTVYVLYNGMFVKSTSGTIPEKRCYLLIDTNVAAGTRGFIIDHGEGSTALRSMVAEGTNGKSDAWYTLQGRRLSAKPTKSGLYLHNGIKVVIK